MQLKYSELREIESSLGVFLTQIPASFQQPSQSFKVFLNDRNNEVEPFIGEVVANDTFFKRKELEKKIIEMIGNKSTKW